MQRLGRLARGVVVVLASCGYSTYYPHPITLADTGSPPEEVPCGSADGTPVSLAVFSSIADLQHVYLVDPSSCTELFQVVLYPSGSATFSTSTGTTWVGRSPSGQLLRSFTVPDGVAEWMEFVP